MVCSLSSDLFAVRTMFRLVRQSENNMAEMSLYTGQSLWDCFVHMLAIGSTFSVRHPKLYIYKNIYLIYLKCFSVHICLHWMLKKNPSINCRLEK